MDPRVLRQTVLVVSLPGAKPEVHVVCIDQTQGTLSIREAAVKNSGEVSLGVEKGIKLSNIQSVQVKGAEGAKVVVAVGAGERLLVGLHTETAEEEKIWSEGLRKAISSDAAAAASKESKDISDAPAQMQSRGSEMQALQARSRQLQTKISSLEALSDRRDRQLSKMMKRLDGAMQMLQAVQEMCQQQRSVIRAQRQAIDDLREDLGEEATDAAESSTTPATNPAFQAEMDVAAIPKRQLQVSAATQADGEDEAEEEEEEEEEEEGDNSEAVVQRKMMQMMSLLQEADELQKILQGLEAGGEVDGPALQALSSLGSLRPAASPSSQARGGTSNSASPSATPSAGQSQRGGSSVQASPKPSPKASAKSSSQLRQQQVVAEAEDDDEEEEEESDDAEADEAEVLKRLEALEAEKAMYENILRASQQEHDEMTSQLQSMQALMAALPGLAAAMGQRKDDDDEEDDDID